MKRAAAVGAAIVAAHAAAFVAIASRTGGDELVIELAAPSSIDGHVPDSLRVEVATEGTGLAHRTWSIAYRGGFVRAVGASALVGPFQDPAAPPCSGRVVVGQRLIDQLAGPMQKLLDAELRGTDVVAIGAYQRVDGLHVQWAELDAHLFDRAFVGEAPHGYLRAEADLVFERVRVPLVLALVPERGGHVRIAAHAGVDVGNRVLQWLSDSLGGDKLATRLARRQLDGVLATTLAPPPPFALGDGQELAFGYCDGDVTIRDGESGALPFAVELRGGARPPLLPAGTPPAPSATTTLALDLDVNALNALLAELWRTGWLDRRLAEVGLDKRFAADPTVAEFLSIRISPPKLALPPVITPGKTPGTLRLAADARIAITDGPQVTTGRVYGALDFQLAAAGAVAVDVGGLELACERTPTSLVPCYADLVAALRDRAPEFHGALTDAFGKLLTTIFSEQRLGTADLPVTLAIHSATPSLAGGVLHLQLDAEVTP